MSSEYPTDRQLESKCEAPLHTTRTVLHPVDRNDRDCSPEARSDRDYSHELYHIYRNHFEERHEIHLALANENRRKALIALVFAGGAAQYRTLHEYVSCSLRTLKHQIYALENSGLVLIDESSPRIVTFRSETIELLVHEFLSDFEAD